MHVDEQEIRRERGVVHVRVPLVWQIGDQDCGAAAVASILGFWGENVAQQEVRHATGTPKNKPIAAGAIQKFLSQRGYESFLIAGTLNDLRRELARGRPILVGMLKPYIGNRLFAHYEIVTGISSKHVYTMNPARGLEKYPTQGFEREWLGAKHLTLVVAPVSPHLLRRSVTTALLEGQWFSYLNRFEQN